MSEPMVSTQPIKSFFQQIYGCIQYTNDGQEAFTVEQILQPAYHAISALGQHYKEACKERRKTM
jgi:hypothetical protein